MPLVATLPVLRGEPDSVLRKKTLMPEIGMLKQPRTRDDHAPIASPILAIGPRHERLEEESVR